MYTYIYIYIYIYIYTYIYIYIYLDILLRILARPACERPRDSNGDRVAHRTCNSVVICWNKRQQPITGGFLIPTTTEPIGHPRRIGLFAKLDLPNYLRE